MRTYSQKQVIAEFEIQSIYNIPKIKQKVYQIEHKKTGAQMVHLENRDTNNAFGIGFLTCPQNSSGIAHILEHIVLCGSKKFPVSDPFFSMLKRSLANFMNAFTNSEWTMYPFATQNKSDFYNLMDVYTDAVFQPLIQKRSFLQEAYRLEKKQEKWVAQGVVFNEMKGAMSSPTEIMYRRTLQAVFPTITYHHNSGGEPLDILDLNLQDLKNFHKTHYHPSNAKFFSYGCFDLSERLEFLNEKVLKYYDKINKKISVGKEKRFTTPQNFEYYYPNNKDEPFYQLALNWLACPITNNQEVLALCLLEEILLGSSAAPLRFKLVESKLGKDLADTTGYHSDYSETFFSIGLKEVLKENLENLENLILDGLQEIVTNGINKLFIESAIHQKELEIKEITSGSTPYSLNLLFRFIGTWMNGGNVLDALNFDKALQKIKKLVAQGGFFEELIKKYFLNNSHQVKILLKPQKNYLTLQEQEIQKKIKKLVANKEKTPEQVAGFKEDLNCLPQLTLQEINIDFPLAKIEKKGDIFTSYQTTNGLEYWSFLLENNKSPLLQNKDVAIIASMVTEIGTQNFRYEEFTAKLNRYTGGMVFCPFFETQLNGKNYYQLLQFSTKSLQENKQKMAELTAEIFFRYSFSDTKRIRQWIEKTTTSKMSSILSNGHHYAAGLASRNFSKVLYLEEVQSGVHLLTRLKEIEKLPEKKFQELTIKFQNSWQKFFQTSEVSFCVTGEDFQNTSELISNLNLKITQDWSLETNHWQENTLQEIWTTPSSVSFVARAYPTATIEHPDSPLLLLLSKIIHANFIHTEIREKGGAYGGIVAFQVRSGSFCFLSYRDPNLLATWEIYHKAIEWVLAGKFTDKQIQNAILQTFGTLDKPLSPPTFVHSDFIKARIGLTYEQEKNYRKRIINAQKPELIKVAENWLTKKNYSDVAISDKERITPQIKKKYQIINIG